jgi:hypothetical protein
MSGPISREALLDGLKAHMAAKLGVDLGSEDEVLGLEAMAEAAIDYFSSSVRGAPPGSGQTLLWAIYSALWEGAMEQDRIDAFFAGARIDPISVLRAWESLTPDERSAPHSVVLVPGDLRTADIAAVTAALFHARGEK